MAADGVRGVEEQIQQHLLDQFANAPDARQRRAQVESQRDFVLELVAQKLLSLGNKLVDIAQFLLLPCPGSAPQVLSWHASRSSTGSSSPVLMA